MYEHIYICVSNIYVNMYEQHIYMSNVYMCEQHILIYIYEQHYVYMYGKHKVIEQRHDDESFLVEGTKVY